MRHLIEGRPFITSGMARFANNRLTWRVGVLIRRMLYTALRKNKP